MLPHFTDEEADAQCPGEVRGLPKVTHLDLVTPESSLVAPLKSPAKKDR